jgi:hypothetical protein
MALLKAYSVSGMLNMALQDDICSSLKFVEICPRNMEIIVSYHILIFTTISKGEVLPDKHPLFFQFFQACNTKFRIGDAQDSTHAVN